MQLWTDVDDYLDDVFGGDDPILLDALDFADAEGLPAHGVSSAQGRFLATLVRMIRARYVLWMPSSGGSNEEQNPDGGAVASAPSPSGNEAGVPIGAGQPTAPPPVAERREDTLTLLRSKGLWHIAKIDRKLIE